MRVVWSPAALRQVTRASDYLTDFNSRAAVALLEGLIAAGDSLAEFLRPPVRGTGMRELVTAYPYIIRYRIVQDMVRILRVRYTSCRPTKR